MKNKVDNFPNIQSGRYEILAVVGTGGAGIVYKALDTNLQKIVAIKKLNSSASVTEAVRFQREAKLAGALKHENVLRVLDFGVTEENEPYLILDFVEGESLAEVIEESGPLPVVPALRLFLQISAGLAHAHHSGVIHRDIKPSNIMLLHKDDGERFAKIVDFGLAKTENDEQSLTKSGVGLGTPVYMPPEQIRGAGTDARSDIYSFGCLMFEVLAGVPPFKGDTALETIDMHLNAEFPDPNPLRAASAGQKGVDSIDEVPPGLAAILARCLEKEPAKRYSSVEPLRADLLNELQQSLTSAARLKSASEDEIQIESAAVKPSSSRRFRDPRILIFVALSALGAIALAIFATETKEPEPVEVADIESRLKNVPDLDDAVVFTKSDTLIVFAKDDEDLKNKLAGEPMKRIDLAGASFTAKGFREANVGSIEFLNFRGVKCDPEMFSALADSARSLKHLTIGRRGDDFSTDGLSQLDTLPLFVQLEIIHQNLTTRDFENISKLKKLNHLDLQECTGITASNLIILKNMPELKHLYLGGTSIGDREVKAASELSTLTSLDISRCPGVTDSCLRYVRGMKRLSVFDVRADDKISIPALAKLREFMRKSRTEFRIQLGAINRDEDLDVGNSILDP
jgi:serine/threonine protein kinase